MITVPFPAPFLLGEAKIVSAEISPVTLTMYSKCVEAAQNTPDDTTFAAGLQTAFLIAQTAFVGTDGQAHRLTPASAMSLPIPVARLILPKLKENEGKAGTVVSGTDGISGPILYRFGTPIKAADGKSIDEIEIQARTYGDLENVLAEVQPIDKTIELLKKCAKPIGMVALPSWALDEILIADGLTITQLVLPRFLE